MNQPQAEGNFCNEENNALKLCIVEHYNKQKGYYEQSDQMANSYSMIQCTNQQQNFFFYFSQKRENAPITLPTGWQGSPIMRVLCSWCEIHHYSQVNKKSVWAWHHFWSIPNHKTLASTDILCKSYHVNSV